MRRVMIAMLVLLLLSLAACTGGASGPEAGSGSGSESTPDTAPPTEMVAPTEDAAPTMEATAEMEATKAPTDSGDTSGDMGALAEGDDGLLYLDAGGCDYGGTFERIEATDEMTVVFTLCKPDPAFLAKIAFEGFGIQSMEHIMATGGGPDILDDPIGTGPYQLDSWSRGESITMSANPDYWGDAPKDPTMVIRWATEGAARLLELQSGQVDQIAFVSPDDFATVEGDSSLQLIPNPNPNIFYIGMTNTFEHFKDVRVRQALAMGIDRQRIVDNFYPTGSEVADYFTPCSIPGGCEGEAWYDYDLEGAKALLEEAGYGDGFETAIYYRDVFRVYLPEPPVVAQELQAQLAELNITAEIMPMESGPFLEAASAGELDGLFLLGWGADFPHPTNFLDYHFGEANLQFGDPHSEIYEPLSEAAQIADAAEAAELYATANDAIRELVPVIPVAHGAAADAATADTENAHTRPFGAVQGWKVDSADDTYIYMGSAEPISLYCADETDGETFRACVQMFDALLAYGFDSGETEPALATECVGNDDATEWTCSLREGVTFHDGSTFDANDVVFTYATGLDASSPYHVGNSGVFEYWSYLFGLMNAPEGEE